MAVVAPWYSHEPLEHKALMHLFNDGNYQWIGEMLPHKTPSVVPGARVAVLYSNGMVNYFTLTSPPETDGWILGRDETGYQEKGREFWIKSAMGAVHEIGFRVIAQFPWEEQAALNPGIKLESRVIAELMRSGTFTPWKSRWFEWEWEVAVCVGHLIEVLSTDGIIGKYTVTRLPRNVWVTQADSCLIGRDEDGIHQRGVEFLLGVEHQGIHEIGFRRVEQQHS